VHDDRAASQVASSWSHSDHEDGGPTIQSPATGSPPHPSSLELESQYTLVALRDSPKRSTVARMFLSDGGHPRSRPLLIFGGIAQRHEQQFIGGGVRLNRCRWRPMTPKGGSLQSRVLPRSSESASIAYDGLARRIRTGVWPARLRRTLTKWEASENPARRPISAVVRRSKSGGRRGRQDVPDG
jgi:hypothetical protein